MGVSASIATSMRLSALLLFLAAVAGSAPRLFSPNETEAALQPAAAHLVTAIASSERSAVHDRGDVVFGGFLQPPSNGFSNDRWALITALTP